MNISLNRQLINLFQNHPHHLTNNSPIPILMSNSVLSLLVSLVIWFNNIQISENLLILSSLVTIYVFILWFKDVTTEGTYIGIHTIVVQKSLSMGVSLFIVTEACVFLSIFWAYFHSSLAPTVELGTQWPPIYMPTLSPIAIPLLNTVLLLSSGATVTYAHHAIFQGNRKAALIGMVITILIASVFTGFQAYEYVEAGFTIGDGAYGSCFYASTGTHGLHIIVGTVFLIVGLVRIYYYHFTRAHHLGLESAILYWHFVDVVWLFLYVAVYWWGS